MLVIAIAEEDKLCYVLNAHYMFALTAHCGRDRPFRPAASKHWHNIGGGGGGGGGGLEYAFNLMQRLWPS